MIGEQMEHMTKANKDKQTKRKIEPSPVLEHRLQHGELDHEVYMQQPEGFESRFGHGTFLQLHKALYGLKQAGHQWHKKLNEVLTSMEFKLVHCDNSI